MRKLSFVLGTVLALGVVAQAAQEKKEEKKPVAPRTLKLKMNYKGAGTVDEKHKIAAFVFDTPDFMGGGVMPIGMGQTTAKDGVVTFDGLKAEQVYVVACYDPKGEYDGVSGPPPSGASMGMYTKTGGPEPIPLAEGKTNEAELTFDDSFKMP